MLLSPQLLAASLPQPDPFLARPPPFPLLAPPLFPLPSAHRRRRAPPISALRSIAGWCCGVCCGVGCFRFEPSPLPSPTPQLNVNPHTEKGDRGCPQLNQMGSFLTRTGVLPWLQNKIFDPVLQVIRRGAEPKQLAFSAALGVTIGIFPICGTTVILGGVAVAMLGSRCNAVTVMVLNLAATPIELSLIIPFLRLGEAITGSGHFPLTADALKNVLTGHASNDVLFSIVHAMLGWLIAAPFVLGVLYTISVPCFKVLVDKFGGNIPSSARTPIKAV